MRRVRIDRDAGSGSESRTSVRPSRESRPERCTNSPVDPLVVVPVKPFASGLTRLSEILDQSQRANVARALAELCLQATIRSGLEAAVVCTDPAMQAWATSLGALAIEEDDRRPPGVDRAAIAGSTFASRMGRPWIVLHADLPLIRPADLESLAAGMSHHDSVIAPSYDGGTAALGGRGDGFAFSYGPGSFRRHLAASAAHHPLIVFRPGLAMDIDRPEDFHLARSWGVV